MKKNDIFEIFPFFKNNPEIIYLDSALTSIKPKIVIEKMQEYYYNIAYGIARSNNFLADKNQQAYDKALKSIARLLNCPPKNLVVTYGVTEGINQLARILIKKLDVDDQIIIGDYEHASNFLPWIKYGEEKKIKCSFYELGEDFKIDLNHLRSILTNKTKILAISHIYNTVGSENDIKKIKKLLKKYAPNCLLVVDGAQAIGHINLNLIDLGVDFYLFGGHKMFGPQGVGILYIQENLINQLESFNYGGGMFNDYDRLQIKPKIDNQKFYGGSVNIAGLIGMGAAAEFLLDYKIDNIYKHCNKLKKQLEGELAKLPNIKIINKGIKGSILLFEVNNAPAEDVADYLSKNNIVVREGANCVRTEKPIFDDAKTIRVSFHIYNNEGDLNKFVETLKRGGDFIGSIFE